MKAHPFFLLSRRLFCGASMACALARNGVKLRMHIPGQWTLGPVQTVLIDCEYCIYAIDVKIG